MTDTPLMLEEIEECGVMWQLIENAPYEMVDTTGRPEDADPWLEWCLLWIPDAHGGFPIVGGMNAGMWLYRDNERACGEIDPPPTHWMALPEPPVGDEK